MSPIGLVCPACKHRLYVRPPHGRCMSFWESQPVAYTLKREPCFVFTMMWSDFRIRSLHPHYSETDARGQNARAFSSDVQLDDWLDDADLDNQ